MDTIVYIDGFNLYFGAVQFTACKWLNVHELCTRILQKHHVIKAIKYFTADVSGSQDPGAPIRQSAYLRALATIPNLEIIKGHFLAHARYAQLAADPKVLVEVMKTEEKGSDVNLATAMLVDGFTNKYDCAVVISNDSDLAMPLDVVRNLFGKRIGVINPRESRISKQLQKHAHFVAKVRQGVLKDSQFPENMTDGNGSFTMPIEWRTVTPRITLPIAHQMIQVKVIP